VCGVAVDSVHKQIYTANNDTAADLMVFNYDSHGDVPPERVLTPAAVGTWGIGLDLVHDEVAVTVQHMNKVAVYRRLAAGEEKPLRIIQGPNTGLSDPHGVAVDAANNEIFVANSGTSAVLVFSRTASGDVAPIRKIQGPATGLRKPVGLFVDVKNDEVWATNPELHTATVHKRTAQGNAPPLRTLNAAPVGAPAPGIGNPGGIAYDPIRQQILVPN